MPSTVAGNMRAIVIEDYGKAKLANDIPIPKLRDGYVLVKPKAVALNPTDWRHIDYLATPGAIVGCDYAGEVLEVGAGVTKQFKPGDRIAGFVHGGESRLPFWTERAQPPRVENKSCSILFLTKRSTCS